MSLSEEAGAPVPPMYRRSGTALNAWLATGDNEAVLEPELEIVDAHHHLWDRATPGRYLLPEFQTDLDSGHRIVSTVYVECGSMYRKEGPAEEAPLGEIEFAAGVPSARSWGQCQVVEGIVGRVDLSLGKPAREVLEAAIALSGGRLRGIRHGLAWHPSPDIIRTRQAGATKTSSRYATAQLALDPTFREGFAQLAPLGLVFDCFVFHTQLDEAADLALAFPETTLVLNHVGAPLGIGPFRGRRADVLAHWSAGISALAHLPNVNVKLGGLGMPLLGFDLDQSSTPPSSKTLARAWRPYIERCIEAFGVDRCMFESNFPPDNQCCTYRTLWNAFKRITSSGSTSEKQALYSGTAGRVYKLRTAA